MHGGNSKGPKTKLGRERSRLAALKHGAFTKECREEISRIKEYLEQSKKRLLSAI
jgi:hypothetical protein